MLAKYFLVMNTIIYIILYEQKQKKYIIILLHIFYFADPEVNELFLHMVQVFEKNSCIRWVPHTNERQFVRVRSNTPGNYPPDRCHANIGRGNSETYIHLSKQCLKLPPFNYNRKPQYYNVAHEMFHALNFAHEHQRRDRDCYIYFTGILSLLVTHFEYDILFAATPFTCILQSQLHR